MGHLEQRPQSSQIPSATLPPLEFPFLGGIFTLLLSGWMGAGMVLLGMKPALGLGQSCERDSCERLEQLAVASGFS